MKEILNHLYEHKTLSKAEAKTVLTNIAKGVYNNSQIASFISVYLMRSITVEELTGFRDALLGLCIPIDLSEYNAIDVCGTGGDTKNTFNISTLTSFVIAGAGKKVAKHGNYSVSSACGSSNVMEYMGYRFTNDQDLLKKQIEEANICFLHAPLFNPAMKNVAPVRRELGVKTFFNMLGPMVNPSFPKNQIVGVYSLELARLYGYLYQQTEKNYIILHSLDVYDEISLTDSFKYISKTEDRIISPEELGFRRLAQEELFGGDTVEEASKIFSGILHGQGSQAQNSAVIANAAMGIQCLEPSSSLADCVASAKESLESGRALQSLEKLLHTSAV